MTTYYVRSDADAGGDGTTSNTTGGTCAWNSIAQINAKAFASGDIVYLRPGDTFDDANFRLTGVVSAITGLTIQGYDFGGRTIATNGLPWLDHDSMYTQIANSNISNLTLKDLNVSGLGTLTTKSSNVNISAIDGVVLDGLYLEGDYGTPIANKVGQNGLVIQSTCTGTIEIKNCEIFNLGPTNGSGVLDMFSNTVDCIGIVINGTTNSTIYIHDNVIHDLQADCIQLYNGEDTDNSMTYVYNNDLYDVGEDNIDVKGYSNVEIYENNFYQTVSYGHGSNCIVVHEAGFLAAAHTNVIIRDNSFYDCTDLSTAVIDCSPDSSEPYEDVKIYNNTFDNTIRTFYLGPYMSDMFIFNNLIVNNVSASSTVGINNGGNGTGNIISNNTFIKGTGTVGLIFYLDVCSGFTIRNNIIKGDRASEIMNKTSNGTDPTIDNNIWYNAGSTTKISWKGTIYNEANWSTWTTSHTNESYADPQVLSTGRLESTSPALGDGVIIAGVNDVGKLDIWGNSANDSPNIGADLGSEQNATSIDTGFIFNESSYIVRVRKAPATAAPTTAPPTTVAPTTV